jgi:hypothetical protein
MAETFEIGQEVEVSNNGRKNGFRGIVASIDGILFMVQHGMEGDANSLLGYYAHELRPVPREAQTRIISDK